VPARGQGGPAKGRGWPRGANLQVRARGWGWSVPICTQAPDLRSAFLRSSMGPGPDQTARDSSSALPGQLDVTREPEALRPGPASRSGPGLGIQEPEARMPPPPVRRWLKRPLGALTQLRVDIKARPLGGHWQPSPTQAESRCASRWTRRRPD